MLVTFRLVVFGVSLCTAFGRRCLREVAGLSPAPLLLQPLGLARPVAAPKQCRKRRAERRQRAAYIRRQRARLRLPHQVH